MASQEEQLRQDLAQEASTHDVDVARLYTTTRARLEARQDPGRVRRLRATRGFLVAAAVVGVVGVVGIGFAIPDVADRLFVDRTDSSGQVDVDFTCPVQGTTDLVTDDDDSFLPQLDDTGRPTGEAAGAPREAVVVEGDRAVLRLGNGDGTLASITTFERVGERYRPLSVTKCTNDPAPGASAVPLVVPGLVSGPDDLRAQDVDDEAVLVADRLTYDVRGLSKRITVYAYPCGRRVCLEAGTRTGTITLSSLSGEASPKEVTDQLTDPDDMVGVEPDQVAWAVYDRDGIDDEVSWTDTAGQRTVVDPVDGATWEGQLFLVLAPADTFDALTVDDGDVGATYRVEGLSGS